MESVAWVTERKNLLSGVLVLSALLVYLRGLADTTQTGASHMHWRSYLTVCVLFVGALLAKTVTCTLPAVLLVLAWWHESLWDRPTVRRLLPLCLIGVGIAAVTVWMEHQHVGATGQEWAFSFLGPGSCLCGFQIQIC